MQPELRLVRYFVAVAEERNFTRAAERLHISQPALSSAIRQLEQQLGVELVDRSDRVIAVTPAGAALLEQGRELLAAADRVFAAVRDRDRTPTGRLRVGLSPTARYGIAPELLAACGEGAPGVMLYTSEDASGALLRDVRAGRLDLAVVFCAPAAEVGVLMALLREEPAVLHVREDHALAGRSSVGFDELAGETLLVAASRDSGGFTDRVLGFCRAAGFEPATLEDPYPDLGLQAVREALGVVVYVRGAFAPEVPGSAFVPIDPPVTFPFHLAWRAAPRSAALEAVLTAARREKSGPARGPMKRADPALPSD